MKDQNPNTPDETSHNPRVGVSACLLGKRVRFDGGHKNDKFISATLNYMEFVKICPEAEAGFGIPRPAMQLRNIGITTELVFSNQPEQIVTDKLENFTHNKLPELADLDGFIFKSKSPSCGAFRVPVVINIQGHKNKSGQGIFAKGFMQQYPLIPVEEEGRLNDANLRENFLERVYAYKRWKTLIRNEKSVQAFIEFHARHKLMLMARGSSYYQELGQIVAGTRKFNLGQNRETYIRRFMEVLKIVAKPGRQVNVLQHILGYLKKVLTKEDKQELLTVFESYRQRQMPLITAIVLLRHHFRVHPHKYIAQQHYLKPYPDELALRSGI